MRDNEIQGIIESLPRDRPRDLESEFGMRPVGVDDIELQVV